MTGRLAVLALAGLPLPGAGVTGVFGGGGGSSSGGPYTIDGTIGQPMVGTFTDGIIVLRSGFWNVVLEVRLNAPGESFAAWMAALPPEDQPPEGLRGPLDMPAGDGVPNIFKYAMGLLPMAPSRDGYPHFAGLPDPANPGRILLAIEMIRSTTANVQVWMEGSPDMSAGNWIEEPYTVEWIEDLEDGRERIRLLTTLSLLPSEKVFLRLNVGLP